MIFCTTLSRGVIVLTKREVIRSIDTTTLRSGSNSMYRCALLFFTIYFFTFAYGQLQLPPLNHEALLAKMNKTGMYQGKILEFLSIFADREKDVQQQQTAAEAYIANLKNPKVKKATEHVFDEVKKVQNFALSALNKTEEAFAPLHLNITQVQQELDQVCEEAKGNFSKCLRLAFRFAAVEAAHHAGKNKTRSALNSLMSWEEQQKADLDMMHKFFNSG